LEVLAKQVCFLTEIIKSGEFTTWLNGFQSEQFFKNMFKIFRELKEAAGKCFYIFLELYSTLFYFASDMRNFVLCTAKKIFH
jgi:hypothetical protein